MKRTIKVIFLSVIIAVLFAALVLSVGAAESAGKGIVWNFNESTGFLELNGAGTMTDFENAEDAPWFSVRNKIKTIGFYGNITNVGSNAFRSCSVEELYLSNTVKTVGASAFEGCGNLKSISLPGVTEVGAFAFSGCDTATSVSGEKLVTIGDNAFAYNCMAATISIGNNVTSIGNYAFYRCSSVKSFNIPAATKTIGDHAFSYCSVLATVSGGAALERIGANAFYFCAAMKSYTFSDSLEYIGESAFEGNRYLNSVALGNGVKEIGANAFFKCMKLTTITGGKSLERSGKRAFFATGYYNDSANWENGVLYIGNCAVAGDSNCPVAVTLKGGTTSIGDGAFAGNNVLLNISFPQALVTIGDYAFSNCSKLLIVYYGGSNTEWTSEVEICVGNDILETVRLVFESYSMAGDLNDDKLINATDAVILAQHIAGWDIQVNLIGADCNGDGSINAMDSVLLAQYIANWDVELKNPGGNTGDYGGDVDIPSDGIFGKKQGDVEVPSGDLLT